MHLSYIFYSANRNRNSKAKAKGLNITDRGGNELPIDYSKYPPNWKKIRARILKRAENRCEFCGAHNYGWRGKTRIILTVAHLDHDEGN